MSDPAGSEQTFGERDWLRDLRTSVELSHKSLGKIGEGDWTPQDSAHLHLVTMVEKFLADGPGLRTGRILHGDLIFPEGDKRCDFVMDACICMKRNGHDGLHACAHGSWR